MLHSTQIYKQFKSLEFWNSKTFLWFHPLSSLTRVHWWTSYVLTLESFHICLYGKKKFLILAFKYPNFTQLQGMITRSDTMKPKLFWIQIWWYQLIIWEQDWHDYFFLLKPDVALSLPCWLSQFSFSKLRQLAVKRFLDLELDWKTKHWR